MEKLRPKENDCNIHLSGLVLELDLMILFRASLESLVRNNVMICKNSVYYKSELTCVTVVLLIVYALSYHKDKIVQKKTP